MSGKIEGMSGRVVCNSNLWLFMHLRIPFLLYCPASRKSPEQFCFLTGIFFFFQGDQAGGTTSSPGVW